MTLELTYDQQLVYKFLTDPLEENGLEDKNLGNDFLYFLENQNSLFEHRPKLKEFFDHTFIYQSLELRNSTYNEQHIICFKERLRFVKKTINEIIRETEFIYDENFIQFSELFLSIQTELFNQLRKFSDKEGTLFHIVLNKGIDRIKSTEDVLFVRPEFLSDPFIMTSGIIKAMFTHTLARSFLTKRDRINFSMQNDDELQDEIAKYKHMLRYFNGVNYPHSNLKILVSESPIDIKVRIAQLHKILCKKKIADSRAPRGLNTMLLENHDIMYHFISDIYAFQFLFLGDKKSFTNWFFKYHGREHRFENRYYTEYILRYFIVLKVFGCLEKSDLEDLENRLNVQARFIEYYFTLVSELDQDKELFDFFLLIKNDKTQKDLFLKNEKNKDSVIIQTLESARVSLT